MATLTYRALHGSAPPYLASSFTCVADMPHRRRLRSASTEQLDVPTCRRSTIGGRAFPVAGAKVWNGLPSDVTSASSLSVFKNRLKTYLFRRCYETVSLSITFPFPSHYLPPQNSGPCNSFYCLGHFKNVYDDDDDDTVVAISLSPDHLSDHCLEQTDGRTDSETVVNVSCHVRARHHYHSSRRGWACLAPSRSSIHAACVFWATQHVVLYTSMLVYRTTWLQPLPTVLAYRYPWPLYPLRQATDKQRTCQ